MVPMSDPIGIASLTIKVSDEPPCERKHKLLELLSSLPIADGGEADDDDGETVELLGSSGNSSDLPRRLKDGVLVVVVVVVVDRIDTDRTAEEGRGSLVGAPLTRFTR